MEYSIQSKATMQKNQISLLEVSDSRKYLLINQEGTKIYENTYL